MKVSQHGSKKSSSSAFLEKLKPEFTLISVGKNNRTKLSHQETLTRLEGINSKVTELTSMELYALKGGIVGKSKRLVNEQKLFKKITFYLDKS